jgi:hypothetical protein
VKLFYMCTICMYLFQWNFFRIIYYVLFWLGWTVLGQGSALILDFTARKVMKMRSHLCDRCLQSKRSDLFSKDRGCSANIGIIYLSNHICVTTKLDFSWTHTQKGNLGAIWTNTGKISSPTEPLWNLSHTAHYPSGRKRSFCHIMMENP